MTQKKRLTVQFFLHKSASILLGASRLCRPCHSTFRIQAFLCKVRRRRDYIRELLNLCRDERGFKFVFASFSGKKGISGKAKKKRMETREAEKKAKMFSVASFILLGSHLNTPVKHWYIYIFFNIIKYRAYCFLIIFSKDWYFFQLRSAGKKVWISSSS